MRQARRVCKEMMIGLAVWSIPVAVILTVLARHHVAMVAGVLLGTLTAAGLLWHMLHHLDIALDMDAGHAQRHTQLAAIRRMMIMGAVLAGSMLYPQYAHPVGTVFGMFGMKISALLYPALHKQIQKREKRKE